MDNLLHSFNEHYYLPLRGMSINKMVDAATPLLGMLLRLKDVDADAMSDKLYQQIVTDIQSTEQLLKEQGYELGSIISFRYVLCTFIDEIALAHGWGSNNNWYHKSLLTHFHNETWGGEKVYILLEKLMADAKRYKDLLEFIYMCFSLGFRGRYKVNNYGNEFELIYKQLYNLLLTLDDKNNTEFLLYSNLEEKTEERYILKNKISIKKILLFCGIGLVITYLIYFLLLKYQSSLILEQLNNLLN